MERSRPLVGVCRHGAARIQPHIGVAPVGQLRQMRGRATPDFGHACDGNTGLLPDHVLEHVYFGADIAPTKSDPVVLGMLIHLTHASIPSLAEFGT